MQKVKPKIAQFSSKLSSLVCLLLLAPLQALTHPRPIPFPSHPIPIPSGASTAPPVTKHCWMGWDTAGWDGTSTDTSSDQALTRPAIACDLCVHTVHLTRVQLVRAHGPPHTSSDPALTRFPHFWWTERICGSTPLSLPHGMVLFWLCGGPDVLLQLAPSLWWSLH